MTPQSHDLLPLGTPPTSEGNRPEGFVGRWLFPLSMLAAAYGLLFLTLSSNLSTEQATLRCVLTDPKLSRIWSVGNIEIGVAYIGVFGSMLFYFLRLYKQSAGHLRDLVYALGYLACSFVLDFICVRSFEPFIAMLVGDAIVMTFTVIVSRQLWFQRLLGVFVPIIFLTCGIGHFLEGLSFWETTYGVNVPWTMVTADIGFAVLVNSSRFPAFIRGEDVINELAAEKVRGEALEREIAARRETESEKQRLLDQLRESAEQQRNFLRDVLSSVTEGRLTLCFAPEDLPPAPGGDAPCETIPLDAAALKDVRHAVREATTRVGCTDERQYDFVTAVSEAAMNAIVHADGGAATVWVTSNGDGSPCVRASVTDHGQGIAVERLPRATLEPGFSTAGTLGQGFSLILKTADRVWLYTCPQGTTVVLEQVGAPSDARLLAV